MGTIYFLNDHGYAALQQFINAHHVNAAKINLDEWRIEVEEFCDNGHSVLEVRGMYARDGVPHTLALNPEHFDAIALTEA